jgi:hypothetical protein
MEDKMKTDGRKSFLGSVPSAALAVFTLVGATIVLFGGAALLQQCDKVGYMAYILNYLVIALGCFFIIRANPKSLWYVPLICNVMSLIAAFVEPNFWHSPLWIPNCAGWALTVMVAIVAWRIGKRAASS